MARCGAWPLGVIVAAWIVSVLQETYVVLEGWNGSRVGRCCGGGGADPAREREDSVCASERGAPCLLARFPRRGEGPTGIVPPPFELQAPWVWDDCRLSGAEGDACDGRRAFLCGAAQATWLARGHPVGTGTWGCAVPQARQESRRRVRWGFAVTEDRQDARPRVRTRRRECEYRHRRHDDPDGSTTARSAHRVALLDRDRLPRRSSPLR